MRKERLTLRDADGQRELALEVVPINRLNERFYLILFQEQIVKDVAAFTEAPSENDRIVELERDLAEMREETQLLQQRYESAHESMRLSTKKSNPAMRNFRASTRSLRPQKKNSSRQTKS